MALTRPWQCSLYSNSCQLLLHIPSRRSKMKKDWFGEVGKQELTILYVRFKEIDVPDKELCC